MIWYILLLLITVFTAVATGAILAATYSEGKDNQIRHWAWLTAICLLIFISILIVNYSKSVNELEITRARMSAGETGSWGEIKKGKKGEVVRIFQWKINK